MAAALYDPELKLELKLTPERKPKPMARPARKLKLALEPMVRPAPQLHLPDWSARLNGAALHGARRWQRVQLPARR